MPGCCLQGLRYSAYSDFYFDLLPPPSLSLFLILLCFFLLFTSFPLPSCCLQCLRYSAYSYFYFPPLHPPSLSSSSFSLYHFVSSFSLPPFLFLVVVYRPILTSALHFFFLLPSLFLLLFLILCCFFLVFLIHVSPQSTLVWSRLHICPYTISCSPVMPSLTSKKTALG